MYERTKYFYTIYSPTIPNYGIIYLYTTIAQILLAPDKPVIVLHLKYHAVHFVKNKLNNEVQNRFNEQNEKIHELEEDRCI